MISPPPANGANDMGRPLDWLVEGLPEDLLMDVEFDHGFPVLRLPRDPQPLTTEDVSRVLHGKRGVSLSSVDAQ